MPEKTSVRTSPGSNWLGENGYTKREEREVYQAQLEDVIADPGWFLDHLDSMHEYRLSNRKYKPKGEKLKKDMTPEYDG